MISDEEIPPVSQSLPTELEDRPPQIVFTGRTFTANGSYTNYRFRS